MSNFEKIYAQYFTDVYKYTFSLCRNEKRAEDITQETFLKALKSIDRFKGDCKLQVWLCQIAKNTYFSMYEKNKKFHDLHWEMEAENFESRLIDKESAFEVHKVLHQLDEPYKEVFSLRMFGELSYAQIGELFEKTESWARTTFYRAKMKIKEELK